VKYDVAISFMYADQNLAADVHQQLTAAGLEVFIFSKEQEVLAGADGLVEFRKVFFAESRLVVVLYREGWGATPWTRIEETAIKDKCLDNGWEGLLFVTLNDGDTPPIWLPKTHLRMNFPTYGLEQTVGAIKVRVQELGGVFRKLDAIAVARLEEKEGQFQLRRRQFLDSHEGVQTLAVEVARLFEEVERISTQVKESTTWKFEIGKNDRVCVLTGTGVSVRLEWELQSANRSENAVLRVTEYKGGITLPNQRNAFYIAQPQKLRTYKLQPDISRQMTWHWNKQGTRPVLITSHGVADEIVQNFIKLMKNSIARKLASHDGGDDFP
jgi:hypothetical protein